MLTFKMTLMKRFLPLILIAAGLAWLIVQWRGQSASGSQGHLDVFCAAGLQKPVTAAAAAFEKETGIRVSTQFGGTGTLLSQLQISKTGDLFIAADDGSLAEAAKRELVAEVLPVAIQTPVIAVPKGNPKGIKTLDDLLKADVKFGVANPEAASISKITRKVLGDRWDAFAAKAAVMKPTVTELAADVKIGSVDAAIVWDSTARMFPELEIVSVAPLSEHREPASAAVLTACKQASVALKFARFLAAPERGGKTMEEFGFAPAGGDAWALTPEVVLFSGGVNRPAIEKLIQEFADHEGVSISTMFNGCGILCATMKTMGSTENPKFPDMYYACDVCFVPPVAENFPEAVMLTETEIGIAMPKGNPKNIQTLADLARPGLRIGLCNAEQSTLGYMTHAVLKSMNLLESVEKNASSQVPTADLLVNQMRVGSLDAAVVYRVSIQHQEEHFDFIPLPGDKARAVQPFAVRKDSSYRQISQRFLTFLRKNHDKFTDVGFAWKGDTKAVKSSEIVLPDWLKPKS